MTLTYYVIIYLCMRYNMFCMFSLGIENSLNLLFNNTDYYFLSRDFILNSN